MVTTDNATSHGQLSIITNDSKMVTTDNATSHGQLSIITNDSKMVTTDNATSHAKGIKQHHNVAGIVHLAHHGSSGGINIHHKPMTTDGEQKWEQRQ